MTDLFNAEMNPETRGVLRRSIGDKIYRPFFIAGIATVLTLGCVWGAINLLAIGLNQNFNTISYSWILAHGHAMVFGFVGFFIMGFAYQMFPRFKQTTLWRPTLAFASLPLMVGGIALQTVAHLIVPSRAAMPLLFGLSSQRSQIRSSSNCSSCPAAASSCCSTWRLSIFLTVTCSCWESPS